MSRRLLRLIAFFPWPLSAPASSCCARRRHRALCVPCALAGSSRVRTSERRWRLGTLGSSAVSSSSFLCPTPALSPRRELNLRRPSAAHVVHVRALVLRSSAAVGVPVACRRCGPTNAESRFTVVFLGPAAAPRCRRWALLCPRRDPRQALLALCARARLRSCCCSHASANARPAGGARGSGAGRAAPPQRKRAPRRHAFLAAARRAKKATPTR